MGFFTAVPNALLCDKDPDPETGAIRFKSTYKLIYALELMHARPGDGRMWVYKPIEQIAEESGYSKTTVKEARAYLVARGLMRISRRMGNTSRVYMVPAREVYGGNRPTSDAPVALRETPGCPRTSKDVTEQKAPSGHPIESDGPHEPEIVYDDEGSNGPPTESARKKKEKSRGQREICIGGEIIREWISRVVPSCGVDPPKSHSIQVKRLAAQNLAALQRDSVFSDLTVMEIMRLLVSRIRETATDVRYGTLWFSKDEKQGLNLLALLSGDWERRKKSGGERDPRAALLD